MKNRFKAKNKATPIKSVLIGVLSVLIFFLILSFITTVILYNTSDPTSKTGLFSIISFVLSGAIATFINTKLYGNENIMLPIFSSLASLVVFMIISLIFCGKITGGNLMSALCFTLASTLALILGKKKKPLRNRHR